MPATDETLLFRYHYDPLDRLAGFLPATQAHTQRFYLKERLTSEIQGSVKRSIFQQDDQLLAQQQRQDDDIETTLLATDQQRSVLYALETTQPHPLAYTPYGHRPAENGLLSLLGFNGERPDPVTGHYLLGNGYRAFNPVLMRFNSPDSLSPFGEGGLNAYTYCAGDPVNHQDPTGHIRWPGQMSYPFPKAMTAIKKVTVTSEPIKNIGPFDKLLGAPHILDNIVSNIESKYLLELSLTSKGMYGLVKSHLRPVFNGAAKEVPLFLHPELLSIGKGKSKGHLPSQVLENETLLSFAKRSQRSTNPMAELAKKMSLSAHTKAKLLESRHALKRSSTVIHQHPQIKRIRQTTTDQNL